MTSLIPRAALALSLIGSFGLTSTAQALDAKQKEEFGAFIKEYLLANPEIMLDVQDALQKKQEEARNSQAQVAITKSSDALFNSPSDLVLGNPKGDVTIVEFFDYNCTYCRHALADMEKILADDKNVRFVLKEFPILGQDSIAAHRVSDAFRQISPEKYGEFHRALLGGGGRATETSAIEAAAALGVTEAQIRKAMADSPNDALVKQTYQLAQTLGISGTPAYVIGNELISGAIGADGLEEKLSNMRKCGKSSC